MKKMAGIVLLLSMFVSGSFAQGKYFTKTGKLSLFSTTSLEDINAVNKSTACVLDTKTGDLQLATLIKGFEFKKALMQEHFNDSYLESKKFPRAEFKGQVVNNSEINYSTNGKYTARVKGKLTVHGVTRDFESTGTITVKDGTITVNAVFMVVVADYNIQIEKLYRDNIAKSIQVTADCSLAPMK